MGFFLSDLGPHALDLFMHLRNIFLQFFDRHGIEVPFRLGHVLGKIFVNFHGALPACPIIGFAMFRLASVPLRR